VREKEGAVRKEILKPHQEKRLPFSKRKPIAVKEEAGPKKFRSTSTGERTPWDIKVPWVGDA